MENKQAPEIQQDLDIQQPDLRHIEFHVSYLDAISGRIEHEEFSDLPAAERFADAQLKDEEAWAVVDVVAVHEQPVQEQPVQEQPVRQQPGQEQQKRAQQLVA